MGSPPNLKTSAYHPKPPLPTSESRNLWYYAAPVNAARWFVVFSPESPGWPTRSGQSLRRERPQGESGATPAEG